jgi:hypothetical protein
MQITTEEKKQKDRIKREKHKGQRKLAAWLKFKKQWENEQAKKITNEKM